LKRGFLSFEPLCRRPAFTLQSTLPPVFQQRELKWLPIKSLRDDRDKAVEDRDNCSDIGWNGKKKAAAAKLRLASRAFLLNNFKSVARPYMLWPVRF